MLQLVAYFNSGRVLNEERWVEKFSPTTGNVRETFFFFSYDLHANRYVTSHEISTRLEEFLRTGGGTIHVTFVHNFRRDRKKINLWINLK